MNSNGSSVCAIGLLFFFIIMRIPGMPAYGPLIGVGGIIFGRMMGWFFGAARDSGKGDWGRQGQEILRQ